jgi:hypothetical protein
MSEIKTATTAITTTASATPIEQKQAPEPRKDLVFRNRLTCKKIAKAFDLLKPCEVANRLEGCNHFFISKIVIWAADNTVDFDVETYAMMNVCTMSFSKAVHPDTISATVKKYQKYARTYSRITEEETALLESLSAADLDAIFKIVRSKTVSMAAADNLDGSWKPSTKKGAMSMPFKCHHKTGKC